MTTRTVCTFIVFLMVFAGCQSPGDHPGPSTDAIDQIDIDMLTEDIITLASDEFEGRAPSSAGEEKTVAFLEKRFKELGLQPGNGDSYYQDVPLVDITAAPDMLMYVEDETGRSTYAYGDAFMAWTKRVVETVDVDDSEIVFVGYGVVAPEYDWDDYADIDVEGKTVAILVNDPGFGSNDPSLFNGDAMTYYGRWTYKFEEAARQGAAAAFIVHETEPAAYPWEVVSGSWSGPQFSLVAEDKNMSRVAVEGWLHIDTTHELFERAGLDFDEVKESARSRDFQPVSLRLNTSISIVNTLRYSDSKNVIAVLPGSTRSDEYIIYTAHWDHFGVDSSLEGDQIFNGAKDNATGTAGLISLAKAYTSLEEPPARSVAFLAVTAEEQGLLGSAYYGDNPIYPYNKTVAVFNLDAMNTFGPTRDITVVGYGNSDLDDYLEQVATERGRVVLPDPEPQKGYFYRSDHFSFAKQGIPALYIDEGIDHVEKGEAYGLAQRDDYVANRYHKPSDEYDDSWDLGGAVEDLKLVFITGYRVANSNEFPGWKEGTEFKAKRERDLGGPVSGH